MNGKKAKQLRRIAQASTVGKVDTYYDSGRYDSMGKQIPTTLVSGCTRQAYRSLKRLGFAKQTMAYLIRSENNIREALPA